MALAVVFAAAFLEALAIVGTVVPGSSIVFAGGILAGLRVLDPWLVGGCAIAGAILGDAVSYELGLRHREAVLSRWPLRAYPQLVARGEAYFARGGAKAVLLGRFLGPVRAIVPLVAGMAEMPARHFYPVNVLSAIGWAAAHLLPGILFGASLELAGAMSSRLVALVALVVGGLWLVTRIVKLLIGWTWPSVARLRDRLQLRVVASRSPIAHPFAKLLDPTQHEPVALLVSGVLLVGGAWLFLGVVEDVVTKDTLVDVDRAIYAWLQSVRTGPGDEVMVTITEFGGVVVMASLVAAIGAWLAITRRFRTLAYWLAASVFAQALVYGLKYALGRARPGAAHGVVDGFSFPSGHAAQSLVVFGFLAFLLGHGKSAREKTVYAGVAVAIALLVALSRLYLGAHWFSDVVASFGLATAWLALLAIAYIQHVHERLLRATPVLLIVLATLTFVGGSYAGNHHERDLVLYAKSTPRPTMSLDAWLRTGFAALPAARTEFAGDREEPFTLQWAATPADVESALAAGGFVRPATWRSSAALLWLLPSTPAAQLPVVPKLHHGQLPGLTLIRAQGERERLVIRMWNVAEAVSTTSTLVPIWVAMITRERAQAEWVLLEVTRTTARAVAPADALARVLDGWQTERRMRAGDQFVLLAWRGESAAR